MNLFDEAFTEKHLENVDSESAVSFLFVQELETKNQHVRMNPLWKFQFIRRHCQGKCISHSFVLSKRTRNSKQNSPRPEKRMTVEVVRSWFAPALLNRCVAKELQYDICNLERRFRPSDKNDQGWYLKNSIRKMENFSIEFDEPASARSLKPNDDETILLLFVSVGQNRTFCLPWIRQLLWLKTFKFAHPMQIHSS